MIENGVNLQKEIPQKGNNVHQCNTTNQINLIQINGRKVLGPPRNWNKEPPSNACELFIKKIPKSLSEKSLLPHFQRFGVIYEFRLMMSFNDGNRGYGYIKYTTEEDANKAMEVMNHFYILPGKTLEIQHSYHKCRLFVGNIPKELSKEEVEKEFRACFPNMEKIVMHTRISDGNKNRGFAFIDFPNHQEALSVKKLTTPGRLRKWDRDLKIVWANPERNADPEAMQNVKTLFARNVDLSVNTREIYEILTKHIDISVIMKISRVREFAFIDFVDRNAAKEVLKKVQGEVLKGHRLELEWAMPPSENSVHTLKNTDFDAVLRLKCIANYWDVPLIVFGRAFESGIQYGAILLRSQHLYRALFVEIQTNNLSDIHSRLCEVAVTLIERTGGLPKQNYVIKVIGENAIIVGVIHNLEAGEIIPVKDLHNDVFIYWDEVVHLSFAFAAILPFPSEYLLKLYERRLANDFSQFPFLDQFIIGDRILGCLNPAYRNKPPLKYNLNNSQIILVLCNIHSMNNYVYSENGKVLNLRDYSAMYFDRSVQNNNSKISVFSPTAFTFNLLPIHFAQKKKKNENFIKTIYFGFTPVKGATFGDTPALPAAVQNVNPIYYDRN